MTNVLNNDNCINVPIGLGYRPSAPSKKPLKFMFLEFNGFFEVNTKKHAA